MGRHTEPLSGGLWTAVAAELLEPGHLSALTNAVYKPGSQALQRAAGRVAWGTVSATAVSVNGLRDVTFDQGDHFVVAMASNKLRYASAEGSGTFADLATITPGSSLEAIQFRNRYYLMNGATASGDVIGSNLVVYSTATATGAVATRQHGMLAVNAAPVIATAAGTFSQTVTGYYEYWTTEVAKLTQDGAPFVMESTFVGAPATVFVTATGQVPRIQLPGPRNAVTTHWRIYRSPVKTAEADKKFPTGYMIAELATSTTSQPDTLTTASATAFPSAINTGTNYYAAASANATAFNLDDNVGGAFTTSALLPVAEGVYGFNFSGFAGAVRGITVTAEAYIAASGGGTCPLTITIGPKRNATGDYSFNSGSGGLIGLFNGGRGQGAAPASKSATITATATAAASATGVAGQVLTFGSPTDRWVPTNATWFTDSDFDSNFMAVMQVGPTPAGAKSVVIDYVKVGVFYGAASDSTVQFPAVVYTFGDITAQVGKNGTPPSADCGDIFEDTLVTNDRSNLSQIKWSAPGDPDSFPPVYFLDFETRENDRVRAIKTVNNRLIVWLDSSAWRVNYLPSERDASFDRGKASEVISRTYGCVNPMCVCTFSPDWGPEQAAFVSNYGIHTSDGFNFVTHTEGLDWRQIMRLSPATTPIALINDRERQELIFYYENTGLDPERDRALHLSYANEHMRRGKMKVSGNVNLRNYDSGSSTFAELKSAWPVQRSNGGTEVWLGYGGSATAAGAGMVYRESGAVIPAQNPHESYTTRGMFLAGMGQEWRLNECYSIGAATGTQTVSYTPTTLKTNDPTGYVTQAAKSRSMSGERLWEVQFDQAGEAIKLTMDVVTGDDDRRDEALIVDGEGFGKEDSGL